MVKEPVREECHNCVAFVNGGCVTLRYTYWIKDVCPFLATEERLKKDKELLDKAIREGRVNTEKYGGA